MADDSDCDDTVSTTYPGADEYCNGVDDDCDGVVDEDSAVDASPWYEDSDSDGYGNAAVVDVECYQPSGFVADDTDCDDTVSTTNPGADEYCDGVDNDCDGDIDEDSAVDATTWYKTRMATATGRQPTPTTTAPCPAHVPKTTTTAVTTTTPSTSVRKRLRTTESTRTATAKTSVTSTSTAQRRGMRW